MGTDAVRYAFALTGLTSTQQCIVQRVAWHCMDDSGFFKCSHTWLAHRCDLSLRSLERHLPQLAKLGILVRGDDGFRLAGFVTAKLAVRCDKLSAKLAAPSHSPIRKDSNRKEFHQGPADDWANYREFYFARCELCATSHDWPVQESYYDTGLRALACPEFRARLKSSQISNLQEKTK